MSKPDQFLPHGFLRVGAGVPVVTVADPQNNVGSMLGLVRRAEEEGVQLLVFPELCVTGYTCADLFHQDALLSAAEEEVQRFLAATSTSPILLLFGAPVPAGNRLLNCALAAQSGKLLAAVPKSFMPGYNEFYEERWFASPEGLAEVDVSYAGHHVPLSKDVLFDAGSGVTVGVEICEDLWVPVPPSSRLALEGATVLCNLSASNDIIGKREYRTELVRSQSGRCVAAYIYAAAGVSESTTDVVFDGHCLIAEDGVLLAESERFSREPALLAADVDVDRLRNERRKLTTFHDGGPRDSAARAASRKTFFLGPSTAQDGRNRLRRFVDPKPFVPSDPATRDRRCKDILSIQTAGLAKRLEKTQSKTAIIGISGGLDSTLALLVTGRTFDLISRPRTGIVGVTMPGFGTSKGTKNNAVSLMKSLGITAREIPITEACLKHFQDIGHDPAVHDVVFENVQARERTQILMDLANKMNGLVVGTGDLSELALGWSTYNGDHMSMYGVNAGIPKTLVRHLVSWVAEHEATEQARATLRNVLETPITPELLPTDVSGNIRQKTEELVGPYELHDFFLYHMVRYGAPPPKILFLAEQAFSGAYSADTIRRWLVVFLERFFSQQFKRSCLPDGPKVGSISLSPRGDWRMPSDADVRAWVEDLRA
ncbi:MAG TPA: NAD(+) synthase [Spirochaetia bacterium]|nr:NAD(+) synthase [Spirochaetia bacterium]